MVKFTKIQFQILTSEAPVGVVGSTSRGRDGRFRGGDGWVQ